MHAGAPRVRQAYQRLCSLACTLHRRNTPLPFVPTHARLASRAPACMQARLVSTRPTSIVRCSLGHARAPSHLCLLCPRMRGSTRTPRPRHAARATRTACPGPARAPVIHPVRGQSVESGRALRAGTYAKVTWSQIDRRMASLSMVERDPLRPSDFLINFVRVRVRADAMVQHWQAVHASTGLANDSVSLEREAGVCLRGRRGDVCVMPWRGSSRVVSFFMKLAPFTRK